MGNEIKSCVIISGAPENEVDYYLPYIENTYIICADSGYLKCLSLGIKPDVIVGDFDSSDYPDVDCEIIKISVRKDDTDTFHCIRLAIERGFEDITILGGIGSRIDHTYSNILSLAYANDKGIKARMINNNNLIFVADKPFDISSNDYSSFSLFALFDKVKSLSIKGAEYELDNYTLEPSDQLTQSNGFNGNTVSITFSSSRLLVILCND